MNPNTEKMLKLTETLGKTSYKIEPIAFSFKFRRAILRFDVTHLINRHLVNYYERKNNETSN